MIALLFLYVAHSVPCQMAEGFARVLAPEGVTVYSAGSAPTFPNPVADAVMREAGVEIADQKSKHVDAFRSAHIDVVITLCGEQYCPAYLGGARRLHWPFEDPGGRGDARAEHASFRRVRDQIRDRLHIFFAEELGALVAERSLG